MTRRHSLNRFQKLLRNEQELAKSTKNKQNLFQQIFVFLPKNFSVNCMNDALNELTVVAKVKKLGIPILSFWYL